MNKKQKKEQQQKQWGFRVDDSIPLILIDDTIDPVIQKILMEIIAGIATIGIQMVFVEPQDLESLSSLKSFENQYPRSVKVLSKKDIDPDAFDIALLDEVNEERLQELKEYKLVPVAERGITAFDPIEEKGTGFVFAENPWSLFAAFVRAAETYRFPYDWGNIVKAVVRA